MTGRSIRRWLWTQWYSTDQYIRILLAVLVLAFLGALATFATGCASVESYVNVGAKAKVEASIVGLKAARTEMCSVASVGAIRMVFPTQVEQDAWQALCGPMVVETCPQGD